MSDFRYGSFSTEMGSPHHVRFPPIATKLRTSPKVRFVPQADKRIGKQSSERC